MRSGSAQEVRQRPMEIVEHTNNSAYKGKQANSYAHFFLSLGKLSTTDM